MNVDEHIEDVLIQVPALMNPFDDNMQSIMLGNFNYHDPKSIMSGASFLQSCYNGSPRSQFRQASEIGSRMRKASLYNLYRSLISA
jgi:hypothetical protein